MGVDWEASGFSGLKLPTIEVWLLKFKFRDDQAFWLGTFAQGRFRCFLCTSEIKFILNFN